MLHSGVKAPIYLWLCGTAKAVPFKAISYLVAGYQLVIRVPVDGAGGVVRCGPDVAEGDKTFDRLFTEHMLAIELGHLRVLGFLLRLVKTVLGSTSAKLFLAGILGDAKSVERVIGFGVHVLHIELQVVTNLRH